MKPFKPKKPKLKTPVRQVIDRYYLFWVSHYVGIYPNGQTQSSYQLLKDTREDGQYVESLIPRDEDGEYDGEYSKAEHIALPTLLKLLKTYNIDPKDVDINNEVYYRKSNGQLLLDVSRTLTDKEYNKWIDDNQAKIDEYTRQKEEYPQLLDQHRAKKKAEEMRQLKEQVDAYYKNP